MSMCGICAMEINVMEYFKPGEQYHIIIIIISVYNIILHCHVPPRGSEIGMC